MSNPNGKKGCLGTIFSFIGKLIRTILRGFMGLTVITMVVCIVAYVGEIIDDYKANPHRIEDTISNVTTVIDRLPNIPITLQSHPTLTYRGYGDCKELEGNVVVLTLFVTDPYSSWTDIDRQNVKASQALEIQNIYEQARRYNVSLTITPVYQDVYAPNNTEAPRMSGMNINRYRNLILSAAGLPGQNTIISDLKVLYGADEVAVMFYTNTVGTSLAYPGNSASSGFENTLMFMDSAAFQHELFHVFGAQDLYTPDELSKLSEVYFEKSVMRTSADPTTDPLTAYLIGWTDTPDTAAINFLSASSHITTLDYQTAREERPKDGYHVQSYGNNTYAGQYYNGKFHGQGTYTWENGNRYEGQWENGSRTGYGTFTWANGSRYDGYFYNGKRTGFGTMRWADGTVYEGDFENDLKSGYGVMRWANGNSYEGSWSKDLRNGYGTLRWSNGDRYVGNFVDGERTGYGTYYWTDGSKHEGNWLNSKREGYGIHTFKNGKTQKGTWVNDQYQKR